mmetsp:Transcript_5261/g.8072  ORF Transcript_5261/g.8072 Transcript_5261/m.8072 type:complete len:350 (-) Transcript_5261:78-1127(-)|eukprot:CAMPEP_0203778362 /NCGR_PEP_ID=MMETSP0099_2-20121227/7951_1 /ASSEMBLY_ACC=CAM_ASM_000209 /TAXON_ID=96639 /ORGANISM=" , Strain NY0313808BC1" /LENGTH=349 /DNA_ID=CAMNT_0050677855 /DNA_START=31 /DNA_END=1080 /DNA_ORIENTATION=+
MSSDVLEEGRAALERVLASDKERCDATAKGLSISGETIRDAANVIAPYTERTPCTCSHAMDKAVFGPSPRGGKVWFKCENLQKVKAFKFRGACNAIFSLSEQDIQGGVVTESSGNHGQAVSLACKLRGCKATIVMPDDAPKVKVSGVKSHGATVVSVPHAKRAATTKEILKSGGVLVHPSNDPMVMSGQGTAFLELWEQSGRSLDAIIVPVGGGGLLSGVAMAARLVNPDIKIIAGEPKAVDDAYQSLKSGKLCLHPEGKVIKTVADALRTTLGTNSWPVVERLVDRIITVEEDEIIHAWNITRESLNMTIEPSSATAVAAAMSEEFRREFPDLKNVGIILSGGNWESP